MTLLLLLAAITVAITCAYKNLSMFTSGISIGAVAIATWLFGASGILLFFVSVASIGLLLLSVTPLRLQFVTSSIYSWFRNVLPEISKTEQEAIDAGTVWWDGEVFSGKPDWNKLTSLPKPELTDEEQAFLDGPVNELIKMTDAWEINHNTTVIPDNIMQYIKDNRFLGMIIPKAYGGLEFSGVAQSAVLSRVVVTGGCVANFISVPNSLGPGELLMKYGTEEQKDYYLPRLAKGIEIPCFALTAPLAGSDATSIPDTGVVCKGEFEGKETIGIKLNFEKRYITLAPIATLVGLAFQLKDPDNLLGDTEDYGITCALIPRETKGISIGRRHKPIGDPFNNGPIFGKDVFIPLDYIIGGVENAGKGWRMLVNCLSVGRCVTLPSASTGIAKAALSSTSAYSALRRQFGIPISMFEGIQKPLARMAGFSYMMDAATTHTVQSLSYGEKPSVPSAILKYHITEMGRQAIIDGMDIQGGKAVMMGPKNMLADAYCSMPVGITVEGANILTRNLMIFGQGATRSHPWVLKEMELAGKEINAETTKEFDKAFFGHTGFTISNAARAFVLGLTNSKLADAPGHFRLAPYYRDYSRFSAAFALVADVSMLTLQSKLKFKEMLSARLGDLLSYLYIGSMVIKDHESKGCPEDEFPLVEWSLQYLRHQYQTAMLEVLNNYPSKAIAWVLKRIVFPLGANYKAPSDELDVKLANMYSMPSDVRERTLTNVFSGESEDHSLALFSNVFHKSFEVKPLFDKMKKAAAAGTISRRVCAQGIQEAIDAGVLSQTEGATLLEFDQQLMEIIHVDHFEQEELVREKATSTSQVAAA